MPGSLKTNPRAALEMVARIEAKVMTLESPSWRRRKRADFSPNMHDHALHALAIRDPTIHVLGAPKLPSSPVRVHLDIEADPEECLNF